TSRNGTWSNWPSMGSHRCMSAILRGRLPLAKKASRLARASNKKERGRGRDHIPACTMHRQAIFAREPRHGAEEREFPATAASEGREDRPGGGRRRRGGAGRVVWVASRDGQQQPQEKRGHAPDPAQSG